MQNCTEDSQVLISKGTWPTHLTLVSTDSSGESVKLTMNSMQALISAL